MTHLARGRRRRKRVSLEDVATAAGVSTATVRRVLAGDATVRRPARERVDEAIMALEYSPTSPAPGTIGGPISLGLLHGDTSESLGECLVGVLEQACFEGISIVAQEFDPDRLKRNPEEGYFSVAVDGILLLAPKFGEEAISHVMPDFRVPSVAVACSTPSLWEMSVSVDDYRASYEMSCHILRLGHSRIGLMTGTGPLSKNKHANGYLSAIAELGYPSDADLMIEGCDTYRSGLDGAERLLDLPDPPSAIFTSTDEAAAAVIAIASGRGLEVPNDLTVCGFKGAEFGRHVWPAITTIGQPVRAMSAKAVKLLAKAVQMKRLGQAIEVADRHLIHDHQLVRRQSDSPPRQRQRPRAVRRTS